MSKVNKNEKDFSALQLAVIYPHVAGIDVGSMEMMLSFQDREGKQRVMRFSAYTQDLKQMGKLLIESGIKQVAMEATGSYWMVIYELLEELGITVTLVNARHYKNVSAQKTDVNDSQWLQQLHAHGLLRGSHIAPEQYRELRTYIHERGIFQNQKSDTLNRIHKVLTLMNVKLQHIISDIEGVSGMKIIRSIASGINHPDELLEGIKISQLKASREDLIKSLEGQYKPHLVIVLQNHLKAYDFYRNQMKEYERLIEALLKKLLPPDQQGSKAEITPKKTKTRKNQYDFNLKWYLEKITGTDLTAIEGIDEISVLQVISVTGLEMNKWKTAEHFTSWLNLCPWIKKSGGKFLGHQKRFTNNPATQAFRLAAQTMWQNKSSLGSLYRRLSASKGSRKAIKAVARRLAVIFYHMLKNKSTYDPKKVMIDEEKLKHRKLNRLQKEAEKLGYKLEIAA